MSSPSERPFDPLRPVAIEPREGFRIRLRYADGVEGEADLSDLAGEGVFAAWLDRAFFETVRITDRSEIVWEDQIDLTRTASSPGRVSAAQPPPPPGSASSSPRPTATSGPPPPSRRSCAPPRAARRRARASMPRSETSSSRSTASNSTTAPWSGTSRTGSRAASPRS